MMVADSLLLDKCHLIVTEVYLKHMTQNVLCVTKFDKLFPGRSRGRQPTNSLVGGGIVFSLRLCFMCFAFHCFPHTSSFFVSNTFCLYSNMRSCEGHLLWYATGKHHWRHINDGFVLDTDSIICQKINVKHRPCMYRNWTSYVCYPFYELLIKRWIASQRKQMVIYDQ